MPDHDFIMPGALVRSADLSIEKFRNGVVVCIYDPIIKDRYEHQEWAQILVNGRIRHHRVLSLALEKD
jgi:hypothetical protein